MIDHKLDTRTVERHIKKGAVTRDVYNKHIEALPDLAETSEMVDYATQFKEEDRAAAAAEATQRAHEEADQPAAEPEGTPDAF